MKLNISPTTLKVVFRLSKPPEECFLEAVNSEIYLMTTNKQRI